MFYRRKSYIVKSDFVDIFNVHFNNTNLPNQIKHGARLIGRWMKANDDNITEIFAIWEYDSYQDYIDIESKVRSDEAHNKRIQDWYEKNGGREHVYKEYILEVKYEPLESTVNQTKAPSYGWTSEPQETSPPTKFDNASPFSDSTQNIERPNGST